MILSLPYAFLPNATKAGYPPWVSSCRVGEKTERSKIMCRSMVHAYAASV